MNEEICCDELARAVRHGEIEFDEGDANVIDQAGAVVCYSIKFCPWCGEQIVEG
jgi:hypothetical protein